ncbi:hypothetical protein FRC17_003330 [Serendipita sp. 399]|nr:hypothetical protein FRC17_003330 [Serendipita sp. 399]
MSSHPRNHPLAEEIPPEPSQEDTGDAQKRVSINQGGSSKLPIRDESQGTDSLNRKSSTVGARYDQPALAPSTIGGSSSWQPSQKPTTVYSIGTYDSQNPNRIERLRKDNDDTASVYSYNSTRGLREFVKEMHGRDKQHSAVTVAMSGLYPCQEAVEAVLSPVEGVEKRILDLGTSPLPETTPIKYKSSSPSPRQDAEQDHGVDIAPTPMDTATFPPNLSFEMDDVNLGLVHFKDSFDLIHMRCVMGGIKDMRKTLEEIQACLKPGGILVVIDGDYRLYKDTSTIYPLAKLPGDADVSGVSEDGSWMSRVMWEAHEACHIAGSNIEASKEVLERGFWSYALVDPETAVGGHFFCPLGSWATADNPNQTQTLQYVGVLMRQNFLNLHRAYHAILRKHGMQQQVLDEWAKMVDEELGKAKRKVWARFAFCCARRRVGPNRAAPSLPASSLTNEPVLNSSQPPFATYEEWYTEELALAGRQRRIRTSGDLPHSAVRIAYANMAAPALVAYFELMVYNNILICLVFYVFLIISFIIASREAPGILHSDAGRTAV